MILSLNWRLADDEAVEFDYDQATGWSWKQQVTDALTHGKNLTESFLKIGMGQCWCELGAGEG